MVIVRLRKKNTFSASGINFTILNFFFFVKAVTQYKMMKVILPIWILPVRIASRQIIYLQT